MKVESRVDLDARRRIYSGPSGARFSRQGGAMTKKIAIVGAGWMAAYHVAGFRGAGAEVVAIVDKNPAAAKAASQKYGVDKTFNEPKELYAAIKDLDAVSIITPNAFHHPLV